MLLWKEIDEQNGGASKHFLRLAALLSAAVLLAINVEWHIRDSDAEDVAHRSDHSEHGYQTA